MTKKDYVVIAMAMYRSRPTIQGAAMSQWRRDTMALQQALASDNPRFDAGRFLAACEQGML